MFQEPDHWYIYFNFHQECDKENFKALDTKLKIGGIAKYMKFHFTLNGEKIQE